MNNETQSAAATDGKAESIALNYEVEINEGTSVGKPVAKKTGFIRKLALRLGLIEEKKLEPIEKTLNVTVRF